MADILTDEMIEDGLQPYCVFESPDFDHEVIDIQMVVEGIIVWVKGFDDHEWKEADEFAQKIADKLGLKFIGEFDIMSYENV